MDHRQFDVAGDQMHLLTHAMSLVFHLRNLVGVDRRGQPIGVTHYAIRHQFEGVRSSIAGLEWAHGQEPKPLRMVFAQMWSRACDPVKDMTPFPFVADSEAASEFAIRWLKACQYPPVPDTDGSTAKGWRVYSERYGHVDGEIHAIIAVAPLWAVYGK